jgi:hypothetical protein
MVMPSAEGSKMAVPGIVSTLSWAAGVLCSLIAVVGCSLVRTPSPTGLEPPIEIVQSSIAARSLSWRLAPEEEILPQGLSIGSVVLAPAVIDQDGIVHLLFAKNWLFGLWKTRYATVGFDDVHEKTFFPSGRPVDMPQQLLIDGAGRPQAVFENGRRFLYQESSWRELPPLKRGSRLVLVGKELLCIYPNGERKLELALEVGSDWRPLAAIAADSTSFRAAGDDLGNLHVLYERPAEQPVSNTWRGYDLFYLSSHLTELMANQTGQLKQLAGKRLPDPGCIFDLAVSRSTGSGLILAGLGDSGTGNDERSGHIGVVRWIKRVVAYPIVENGIGPRVEVIDVDTKVITYGPGIAPPHLNVWRALAAFAAEGQYHLLLEIGWSRETNCHLQYGTLDGEIVSELTDIGRLDSDRPFDSRAACEEFTLTSNAEGSGAVVWIDDSRWKLLLRRIAVDRQVTIPSPSSALAVGASP